MTSISEATESAAVVPPKDDALRMRRAPISAPALSASDAPPPSSRAIRELSVVTVSDSEETASGAAKGKERRRIGAARKAEDETAGAALTNDTEVRMHTLDESEPPMWEGDEKVSHTVNTMSAKQCIGMSAHRPFRKTHLIGKAQHLRTRTHECKRTHTHLSARCISNRASERYAAVLTHHRSQAPEMLVVYSPAGKTFVALKTVDGALRAVWLVC